MRICRFVPSLSLTALSRPRGACSCWLSLTHMGNIPFALPVLIASPAAAHPETINILTHLGTQQIPHTNEGVQVVPKKDKVLLERG